LQYALNIHHQPVCHRTADPVGNSQVGVAG
jgi:hypothetical protein